MKEDRDSSTMPEEWAIEIVGLSKAYGDVRALRGVDLSVRTGEIFGFLGPNGAGKTTTLRCLLDMIRPSAGTLRVLGLDPQVDSVAVRWRVGYLPGELNLDDNLTAREVLRLFDAFRGGVADWDYIAELARRLQLDMDRPTKQFSKGNKQKVGVVQAFMHHPELLLLDEPTSGLDPLMQQQVLQLVREANERGTTVFFSSHILSEAESVCHRIGIVRRGKLVEVTDTEHLTSRSFRCINVKLREHSERKPLRSIAGVKSFEELPDGQLRLRVEGDMDAVIKALAQMEIADIEIERPSLEEIFLTYYEDQP